MSLKQKMISVGLGLKKHSPAIFVGVGIVGIGATAYLAYKSKDKVEEVVENIEDTREQGRPVNKMEVATDLSKALYLPITTGVLSVGSILLAHDIQRKRILALSGALAAQQAQNLYFESKYRKKHGDKEYEEFSMPVEEVEREIEGKNGKTKKVTTEQINKDIDGSIGQWYDDSQHYAADDHLYNMAYIDSVSETLQTRLFQRGTLLLNEVREELGFERIRAGALLGWKAGDYFDIRKSVTVIGQENEGELKEQIFVSWSTPSYIYDDVDFNGRYNPYGVVQS